MKNLTNLHFFFRIEEKNWEGRRGMKNFVVVFSIFNLTLYWECKETNWWWRYFRNWTLKHRGSRYIFSNTIPSCSADVPPSRFCAPVTFPFHQGRQWMKSWEKKEKKEKKMKKNYFPIKLQIKINIFFLKLIYNKLVILTFKLVL